MTHLDYLALAMRDCRLIELRHEDGGRWISGTFSDLYLLRQEIDARSDRGNLFTSINAPAPLVAGNVMGQAAWRDDDVEFINRLFVDFDPVRPRGVPSTDGELAAAVDRRNRFVAAMTAAGWPHPALGVSGNGAHALYRCRLRATAEVADQLARLYRRWKLEWSDDVVEFDPTVRNPARICRLYGTTNRKGIATLDRPHRLSSIVVPRPWSGVSPAQIARAAAVGRIEPVARRTEHMLVPAGYGDYATLDVKAWFQAHGAYKCSVGDGIHAATCPWEHEHTTTSSPTSADTVIFDAKPPGLWPRFFCHHAHCDGRDISDVIALWGDADTYCASAFQRRAQR